MKASYFLCITLIVAFIYLLEWRGIPQNSLKERAAFLMLTSIGWLLAVLLLFFPAISGPSRWIDALFSPIVHMFS
ncbi:hypothetical protein K0T92_20545 [Paenibacillus oenotherae]|uniref:Uncharacterized protein n=1 Tax=Paenibacillus oenotherae TaxID=1435645 RepID=A0ABS7DAY5_9BACL|nr:hypothetical protein [Paenibacillus oenotherae]MBW7477109.1 hypothetical protein [Paenibacillus oenotherae]